MEQDNNWQNQYVNELYLSIIIEGLDTSLAILSLLLDLYPILQPSLYIRIFYQKNIRNCKKSPKKFFMKPKIMVQIIRNYYWNGVLYSQPMRFWQNC